MSTISTIRNDSGFGDEGPPKVGEEMESIENDTFADAVAENQTSSNQASGSIGQIVQSVLWSKVSSTMDLIKLAGIKFALACTIWFMGYFNFSLLWIFIGVWCSVVVAEKIRRRNIASKISKKTNDDTKQFVEDMKMLYRCEGRRLPSWLYFPDMERAEWLNRILQQLWPNVGDYVKELLVTKIQPSVQKSQALLSSFVFAECDLGDRAPRIAGIKVYDRSLISQNEIVMDVQFVYDSECNLGVSINGLQAGIKDLQVRGLLRVNMQPLMPRIPIVGALSLSFIQDPQIDFDLTGLANLFDLPGIDDILRESIVDCVGNLMVMPEKYIVKLSKDVDVSKLKYPIPKGLIRIHVLEAKNLEEKDRKFLGLGGGSDPFVTVKVGHRHTFKTAIIHHTTDPVWNESFDVPVADVTMTQIQFMLHDDDGALNKADFLGSASVPIQHVFEHGVIDEWITLNDVASGSIHVKLEWYDMSEDPADLDQVLAKGETMTNTAFFNIYADSAQLDQDFGQENFDPSPSLKISITGKEPLKTQAIQNTTHPVWEENFQCLMANPQKENIIFEVENDGKTSLGRYELAVGELLKQPRLTLDEPLFLKGGDGKSVLNVRLTLRILKAKPMVEGLDASKKITVHKRSSKPEKPSTEPASLPKEKSSMEESDTSTEPGSKIDFEGSSSSSLQTRSSLGRTPSLSSEVSNPGAVNDLRKRLNAKMKGKSASTEELQDNGLGRLKLTYRYNNNQLGILVVRAEKLIVCDVDNDTSDPYVRVHLNNNKKNREKTKVVKNCLDPVFDQKLTFNGTLKEFSRSKLTAVVKNQTGFLSSEKVLMGQVTINLADSDLTQPTTQWYPLQLSESS